MEALSTRRYSETRRSCGGPACLLQSICTGGLRLEAKHAKVLFSALLLDIPYVKECAVSGGCDLSSSLPNGAIQSGTNLFF